MDTEVLLGFEDFVADLALVFSGNFAVILLSVNFEPCGRGETL